MLNKLTMAGIVFYFLCGIVAAQDGRTDLLRLKYIYNSLEYENTINEGRVLLASGYYTQPEDIIYIHQLLAYAQFNLGREDSARVNFLTILSIDADYQLDAVSTSPKILDFFSQIREDLRMVNSSESTEVYTRYVFIEDLRPGAAWRSALFPGWGQFYKHQESKAYIMGGSFISSVIITVVSHSFENTHKQRYIDGVDDEIIADEYDKFNNWSKTRRAFTYISVGIWLASFADALWCEYPQVDLSQKSTGHLLLSLQIPL